MLIAAITSAAAAPLFCMMLTLLIGSLKVQALSRPLSLMATGLLITLAFSHLLPEAMEMAGDVHTAGYAALTAILILIAFEMFFAGRHGGHQDKDKSKNDFVSCGSFGLFMGTALHTFCDGMLIASAFMVDESVGIAAALAIMAHEVPQELGDYAVLIDLGLRKDQAFGIYLTALTFAVTGTVTAYLIINSITWLLPIVLSAAAASFIYVALSDLLPRLKRADSKNLMLKRYLFILAGAALAIFISNFHVH